MMKIQEGLRPVENDSYDEEDDDQNEEEDEEEDYQSSYVMGRIMRDDSCGTGFQEQSEGNYSRVAAK